MYLYMYLYILYTLYTLFSYIIMVNNILFEKFLLTTNIFELCFIINNRKKQKLVYL